MKKTAILLALVLLLSLTSAAWAEDGQWVEVIREDGIGDAVLADDRDALTLPQLLVKIDESAFEAIAAASVEVLDNVTAIGKRAFADCDNLREITNPATVTEIDDQAFEGCHDVKVYGYPRTEAFRIAQLYDFTFVNLKQVEGDAPAQPIPSAPVLPAVSLN